jgi:hypothetical protein
LLITGSTVRAIVSFSRRRRELWRPIAASR